jgi:hypothetical protein
MGSTWTASGTSQTGLPEISERSANSPEFAGVFVETLVSAATDQTPSREFGAVVASSEIPVIPEMATGLGRN